MTTQTETERRNPARPETEGIVTANADELLKKDLPRPKQQGTGTEYPSPLEPGPGPDAAYNTIDLGEPSTSVGMLRPVELGTEIADPPESNSHRGSENRSESTYSPAEKVETRIDPAGEVRTQIDTGTRPAAEAPPASQTASVPPPAKSPSFKATLAGGVLGQQVNTKVPTQHRTTAKVEPAPKSKPWIKIAGYAGATLAAVVVIAYLVAQKPAVGSLTGVVVDAQTGRIIPSAAVELDGKRTATTNAAGLYTFTEVTGGSYLVKASAPGYEPQTGTVQTTAPQSAQLSFALAPSAAPAPTPASPPKPINADSSQATSSTSSSPGYGGVDLEVDFEGYLVFVDGEIYGKNAKKLKRLTTGEHRVVVQAEGYQDYSTIVTVKARITSTVTIVKADLTPKIDPIKRSHGLFAEGKDYLDRGLWQPAIESFDQSLASDAQNADAVKYRGWAHMKLGDTTKARDDFTRAAHMYDDSRRLMEAVTCAGYLIDLTPGDAALWRQRSDYYLSLTEYAKAISDCEHAIKLDKKSVESQMALAEAYYASRDFRRAAKEFDRARKMSGDPLRPYVRMILAFYNAGENDEMLKKYREFTKIAPQDLLNKLQNDPEWLPVLQMVGPEERHKN